VRPNKEGCVAGLKRHLLIAHEKRQVLLHAEFTVNRKERIAPEGR